MTYTIPIVLTAQELADVLRDAPDEADALTEIKIALLAYARCSKHEREQLALWEKARQAVVVN